ncbi:putative secreted protein, signal peptide [Cryptosporidium felis]|nr:putative secreted protein, signal peptide [Cryptosporidium felis]
MNKIWGVRTLCLVFIFILSYVESELQGNYNNFYKGTLEVEDLNNIEGKRSENDKYVFSDNMLQLSNQFPVVSPFESLSLIWLSIHEKVQVNHKNEGALIILYLVNPIYKIINEDSFEGDELFHEADQFDERLSQVIYCLIQSEVGIDCEQAFEEMIAFLNDQVLIGIQKNQLSDREINFTNRIGQIVDILIDIKNKQLFNLQSTKGFKLYNTFDPEAFLLNLFNIKNLFEFYVGFQPGIPYMGILNPLRTLLDFMDKNWENRDHEKSNNLLASKASPLKGVCDEMISGVKKILEEIDRYFEPKSLEKLIILTETKLYSDSLGQLCEDYNEFVGTSTSESEKNREIPEDFILINTILINSKESFLRRRTSRLYEQSRKAADTNSSLCIVNSDNKVLSSEGLSEYELDQEISTTLLDLIGNFFQDSNSDPKLNLHMANTCPTTKDLVQSNKMLGNGDNFINIGNHIKDLASILSIKRTNLASKICSKLVSLVEEMSHANKKSISTNRLLIPIIVNSSLMSILPGNANLYRKKTPFENEKDTIQRVFVDHDKSCLINNFDLINYYLREVDHICKMVRDHSSIFGSAFNKIANQKVVTQLNQSLQKVSQSQILHEFREIGRDMKGSKYGHFMAEVGNNCFSSLGHWYHFNKRRRKLKGARRLLRKAFYAYTSSLDNINMDLRPELKNIQAAAAKLETNELKILTSGEFVFLNSKVISRYMKKRYSKHTAKIVNEHYKPPAQMLKEDFPITIENMKELNSLIKLDMETHKGELEQEISLIQEIDEGKNGMKSSTEEKEKLPFFKSGKKNFVLIGRDFSSFALCQCKIRGSKQTEMLKLFFDLLFQIQHTDTRVMGYEMLSHSLKKAIRQMLIVISLNEFAIHLLPKVRKGGYQRFYRMKHSTHKALRKRVKKYLKEIKRNNYKLSVVISSLHHLLMTAFNHFRYDPELELLRRSLLGIDIEKSEWGTYSHNTSMLRASEAVRRRTIEKLVGDFYFGRIRRSFSSLKETVLQMMNPQQILGLVQIFKSNLGVKDIDGIASKLHQHFKSIYPSQNCIGVDQGQKLESFFALC